MHPLARWTGIVTALLIARPAPAFAQDVAFVDLQGTTINATVNYDQTLRNLGTGQVFSNSNQQSIKLRVGPGEELDQVFTVTIIASNGRVVGSNSFPAKLTLNKPKQGKSGHMLWTFDGGKLTWLQTFESGGRRITISFKRSADGLSCSVEAPFAREQGAGSMQTNAAVGNFKMEWLNVKQASSNCRVEKSSGR